MWIIWLAIGSIVVTVIMGIVFYVRDNSGTIRNERQFELTKENFPPKNFFDQEH